MFRTFQWAGRSRRRAGRVRPEAPATRVGDVDHPRSPYLSIFFAGVSILLLTLTLVACGSGGGGGAQGGGQAAGSSADYDPSEADFAAPPGMGAEGEAASAAAGGGAASSSAQEGEFVEGGAQGERGSSLPGFEGEKIVKTAELGMSAGDVRESASEAQGVAARFGGSVLSSRIDGEGGSVTADLVLTVPSGEFESALDDLRGLGEVTTDTVGGEDVTEEFVDLRSRERNLLAAEESLLRLYDEAESVDDALSIERELTDLREQIEVAQGRLQYLEDRTSTSRIALTIRPVETIAGARPAWEPVRVASKAWNASLGFLGTVAGAALSVVVFGWWFLPAIVAAAILWRRRKTRATSPAAGP